MWNLTVCSLMCSSRAIILFDSPCPSRSSTSLSRAVNGSESSSTAVEGSSSNRSARVFGSTVRPWATAATAAPSSSAGESGATTPQPLRDRARNLDASLSSSESNSSACVPSSETPRAVSSSSSSSATSTTSAPESGGKGPADRPASPTISKSAVSTDASIERSPPAWLGSGPRRKRASASCRASRLFQVHFHYLDITAAHHAQRDAITGSCCSFRQGSWFGEPFSGGGEQDIADQQARPVGGATGLDGGDHEPRGSCLPSQGCRHLDGQYPDPEPRTAVSGHPRACRVARDGEGHLAEDHRVDSHDLAPGVEERAARVPRREGDVRPYVPRGGTPTRPAQLAHAANDACANSPDTTPGMPDSVDQFADSQGIRVPDGSRRQVFEFALQSEQGEVQTAVVLDYPAVEHPAVAEGDPDLIPPAASPRDHVMVRQDQTVSWPDHPRTDAPATATHLYDALLRLLYHPRACQHSGGVS